IFNRNSGKSLDLKDNSSNSGAPIQQWDYLGGSNQNFRLVVPLSALPAPQNYRIVNVNSGKALDVRDASPDNAALIQQWDYVGGTNQQWLVGAIDSTYSTI